MTVRLRARALLRGPALALCLLLAALPAAAQKDSTGQLSGTVVSADARQPIEDVAVQIVHLQKGLERVARTSRQGTFLFKALPVGVYSVTVSFGGYQTVVEESLAVELGRATVFDVALAPDGVSIDESMTVVGGQVKPFNVKETSTGLVITTQETETLPVQNNLNAVALLAPGTALGDSDFGSGNLVSFGGSSLAENGYYLNGLNITDIRRGIGHLAFPWEAVDQIQVKNGGTPAEFGRHIGGVMNMVTKSGTNKFHFGFKPVYDPEGLRGQNPTVFFPNSDGDSELLINNSEDSYRWTEYNVSASGPIVQDRAFFYVLYNPRESDTTSASTSNYYRTKSDADFWLSKLDWYITEDHALELLAFNNETKTKTSSSAYSYENGPGNFLGNTNYLSGGDVYSARYNGNFTETLSVSATWGKAEYANNTSPDSPELSSIWDSRSGTWVRLGNWVGSSVNQQLHERTNWRIDADWVLGKHSLRFGLDREKVTVSDKTLPTGDGAYSYYRASANNTLGLPVGTEYLDQRVFVRGGTSDNTSDAWYIQDSWSIGPRLTLNLGLRNTTFQNTTSDGQVYVDIDNQIAPRLGAAWDLQGNGKSKLYASYGRFFMPVSANTNIRMASGELDEHYYYILQGVNADGTPVRGNLIRHDVVSDGVVPDADRLFNHEAGPMYSDEYLVGYERELQNGIRVGVRGTYRDLIQSIEDVSFSYGMNAWIDQNYPGADHVGGWFSVLTNPGKPITIPYDVNGDGIKETVTVSPEQLGFPPSTRKYYGIETVAEGRLGERLNFSTSYTWSHNYGNTEGLLRSDNDQVDPGWTTSYDYPELMDYSYGDLPNDHRHQFKAYGSYELPANLSVGANANVVSGRPLNSFGLHPEDDCTEPCYGRIWYGAVSFYTNGQPMPRGSAGRTPWVYNLDLNLAWKARLKATDLLMKVDFFNVFDTQRATQLEEYAEFDSGEAKPYYGQPTSWQAPRSVRFSLRVEF